jgi:hypothetical protein
MLYGIKTEIILNSNKSDRLCAAPSGPAVPYPDACLFSIARPRGGKRAVARWRAGLQAREGLHAGFVCLFTLSDFSNTGILIIMFI